MGKRLDGNGCVMLKLRMQARRVDRQRDEALDGQRDRWLSMGVER